MARHHMDILLLVALVLGEARCHLINNKDLANPEKDIHMAIDKQSVNIVCPQCPQCPDPTSWFKFFKCPDATALCPKAPPRPTPVECPTPTECPKPTPCPKSTSSACPTLPTTTTTEPTIKPQTSLNMSLFFEPPLVSPGRKYFLSKPGLISVVTAVGVSGVCTALEGHLAEIDDAEEYELVKNYVSSFPGIPGYHNGVFISGNDVQKEGTWRHYRDDRKLNFTAWISGQPDNGGGKENCLELWRKYDWKMNDQPCSYKGQGQKFICEIPDDD